MKNQIPHSAPNKLLQAPTLSSTIKAQLRSYVHHCRMIKQHSLSDFYRRKEKIVAWEKVNVFYNHLLLDQYPLALLRKDVLRLRGPLEEILPHPYNISYKKSLTDYLKIINICETLMKKSTSDVIPQTNPTDSTAL